MRCRPPVRQRIGEYGDSRHTINARRRGHYDEDEEEVSVNEATTRVAEAVTTAARIGG